MFLRMTLAAAIALTAAAGAAAADQRGALDRVSNRVEIRLTPDLPRDPEQVLREVLRLLPDDVRPDRLNRTRSPRSQPRGGQTVRYVGEQSCARSRNLPYRYGGDASAGRAPAYKAGRFVYEHLCLPRRGKQRPIFFSSTPPDAPGDAVTATSGAVAPGTQVSRRNIRAVAFGEVCRVFDYNMVNGRMVPCEPYGWRYPEHIRRTCFEGARNGPAGAAGALLCQAFVFTGAAKPFEQGPRQKPM